MVKKIMGFVLIGLMATLIVTVPYWPFPNNEQVNIPAFQNIPGKRLLLYIGYPACDNICPLVMAQMAQIYTDYNQFHPVGSLRIAFINLASDDVALGQAYATRFHEDFITIQLSVLEMKIAKSIFGLNYSEEDEDGQIRHKGYTYLLEKKERDWFVRYIYRNGVPEIEVVLKHLEQ